MQELSELHVTNESNDAMSEETDAVVTDAPSDETHARLARVIESVLFAAAAPVSLRRLVEILEGPTTKEVQAALKYLGDHYAPGVRGIQLQEVAGGYQFRTARENAAWVRAVFKDKPSRLGRAALETLAIVAYKQPATKAEIEAVRGVDVDGVLTTLLSRRLIKISGRKEAVGRPLLYATTPEFLEAFGLKDLGELPSLKELGPAPDENESAISSESTVAIEGAAGLASEATAEAAAGTEAAAGAAAADDSGALTEAPESSGDCLAPEGGGTDPDGPRAGERPDSDPAGDEGGSAPGSDHG